MHPLPVGADSITNISFVVASAYDVVSALPCHLTTDQAETSFFITVEWAEFGGIFSCKLNSVLAWV